MALLRHRQAHPVTLGNHDARFPVIAPDAWILAMERAPTAILDPGVFDLEEFDDGRRLEPLIGVEAFAQLRTELVAYELPERVIERLKPWAAMMRITRIAPRGEERSLDEKLFSAARARRMRTVSLEWVEEQIASFDAVPLDSQVALLKHALAYRDGLAATAEPIIDAWLRGDLAALAQLPEGIDEQFPGMGNHYRQLTKHIIHDRTIVMHHRLFMPLRNGGVFVAVGASHVYGAQGLLAMLERDGFRVVKVW